jgi:hypothetical protein
MEMQQMMEMLLKEIKAGQEQMMTKLDSKGKTDKEEMMAKLDANQEKMEADRKADQERMEADRRDLTEMMKMMQAYQAKIDAVLPAMQVTETSRKETAAVFKPETEVRNAKKWRRIKKRKSRPQRTGNRRWQSNERSP